MLRRSSEATLLGVKSSGMTRQQVTVIFVANRPTVMVYTVVN